MIPASLKGQNLPRVRVKMIINKDGAVSLVEFLEQAPSEFLNRSIQEAIKTSMPFPPFPKDLKEEALEITINFDINGSEEF